MSTPEVAAPGGLIGRKLGDFTVRQHLGEGGQGLVFTAEQTLLGRAAVIKVLRQDQPGSDSSALTQRFLREARVASRLDHPYAAHVYAFGAEPDGLLWIAMELVRGTPLDRIIATQGPLPLERFVPLFQRICEVVHAAHEHGIVHRDLKPPNVMVISRSGMLLPKLLDFGIAKHGEAPPRTAAPVDAGAADGFDAARSDVATLVPLGDASTAGDDAVLTKAGMRLGSPRYMAPEQWIGAATSSATDLYALGILAYETLTGQPPFIGKTAMQLARAHARDAPPPLGGGLPTELDAVLAKAMAKRQQDRPASALELGHALRKAAGLGEEPLALPSLPPAVRESLIATAPQPIAEAVGAIDAARSPHQARDAYLQVARVVAQTIGVLALSARSRFATRVDHDADDLLRVLHRRGLAEREWITLARALVRDYATRAEAHPIPELVRLFFDEDGVEHANVFEPLLQLAEAPGVGASEQAIRTLLQDSLAAIGELMRRLAFLSSYAIVVSRGGRVERWAGARRPRAAATVIGALADHRPVLVDAEGVAILQLWPLVQVVSPAPGAELEMFMLRGPGRNGAALTSTPGGFIHEDTALWAWFRTNVLDVATDAAAAEQEQAPYRGLEAFATSDASLFFGREAEVEAALNRLRTHPVLAVVGPSGAGKSSFVQAGVLAGLEGWRAIVVRPGSAPLAQLRARLQRERIPVDELREALRRDVCALGLALRAFAAGAGERLALFVDQAEEIFTLGADEEEQALYLRALFEAARSVEEPIRVLFSLRDDFLMRLQRVHAVRDGLARGLMLLGAPSADDLLRIVIEPARRQGYELEDPALAREMVAEVAGERTALPLLSFTASRLWLERDRHFKQLGRRAYHALGGVAGALAQHAEKTLEEMSPAQRQLTREAFRHLVTADNTRAVMSRAELLQVLRGPAAEETLERLVSARLLVTSDGDGGSRVEIVHEALLSAWPRLVEWRREDAEGARLRDQLRAATAQWAERGRPQGLLWRDEALAEYRVWHARHPQALTDAEQAFAAASLRDEARARRARQLIVGGVIGLLCVGLVAFAVLNRRIAHQRQLASDSAANARRQVARLEEEQGREFLEQEDAPRALPHLVEAMRIGRQGAALDFLIGDALDSFSAERRVLRGHQGAVNRVRYSPDGDTLATAGADGIIRLWDRRSGALVRQLEGHRGSVSHLEWSRDGRLLLSVAGTGGDGTVRLWDRNGNERATLPGFSGDAEASLSPDGNRLMAYGGDKKLVIADTTGRLLHTIGPEPPVEIATWAGGGRWLVSAAGKTATLWDAASGKALRTLAGHGDIIFHFARSPDDQTLATASLDGTVRLWSLATGKVRVLDHHGLPIRRVAFSPDGHALFAAGLAAEAWVWDPDRGVVRALLRVPSGQLLSGVFGPGGRQLFTYGQDSNVRLWDVDAARVVAHMAGHQGQIMDAAVSPDGKELATSGVDGTVRLFEVAARQPLVALRTGETEVQQLCFGHDGVLRTASADGTLRAWNREGTAGERRSTEASQVRIALSRAGVAATARGRIVRVWAATGDAPASALEPAPAPLTAIAITADGKFVLGSASDGSLLRWQVDGGRIVATRTLPQSLETLAIDPSSNRAVGSRGARAWVWRIDGSGSPLELLGHSQLINTTSFSADGRRVVTGSDDHSARVWDVDSGRALSTITARGEVGAAALSPDSELIATVTSDGILNVWDLQEGRALSSLQAHRAPSLTLVFSPDGLRLASGALDGTAAVWAVRRSEASLAQLDELLRCRGAFRLVDGRLASPPADACDPAWRPR